MTIIIRDDVALPPEHKVVRSKYPWDTLVSGQAFFEPVTHDQVAKQRSKMRHLAAKAAKRYNRKYEVRAIALDGLQQQYIGCWLVEGE